ncbi:MAG: alpha/beta hydrolase [Coriobacteriales bacterium]|nr:alpha/beta hydrolase [Coriobacteriales bacterium]
MAKISWENGYIRNEDAALYYEVHRGALEDAPILILLHGNGEDMHVFDGHIEQLLPYYTVLTVDTRGHGKSSRGDRPLSYELFATDLFTLANKLQIGNLLILGFSDGANTALELALRHQERIGAMILVGANLHPEGLTPLCLRGIQLKKLKARMSELFMRKDTGESELADLMLTCPNIEASQLKTVTIPTLVISGEKDFIKEEHTELIATSLANARWQQIKEAGHFVMKDAPEEFDQIILKFLMEDD